MNVNKKLIDIKNRIEERSKDSRSDYLKKIKFSSDHSKSARNNMGCSNIAHAFASCDKAQQNQGANGGTVIGVVPAYNDMLSAHAPLKDYPDIIKNSAVKKMLLQGSLGACLQCVMESLKENLGWSSLSF